MNTLHALFAYAKQKNASDIHLSAGDVVRLRIDGEITPIGTPIGDDGVKNLIKSVMSDEQYDQFLADKDLDFSFEIDGLCRFRANVFQQHRGASATFRLINDRIFDLNELRAGDAFKKFCQLKQGLVLVTGATGSGKSTTLSAMIDHINTTRAVHILTLEDPIEFIHTPKLALINQREIHRDTHDFHGALRAAMREDPDVILIGELRDLQSIRLALRAAETGHLVLATLHTNSAAKAIDRIIDVFDSHEKSMIRTMLSESLQAVISQTLMPKVGGGRIAAFEIMVATTAIRHLIRENKVAQIYSAIQMGTSESMISLDASLQQLLKEGLITVQTAKMIAKNPDSF
ncbi:type IV pilus twitching motility protein PilT [Moraxella oculi]|uniref:Type IV pilus twitching motility protein PilT n=1 Tax=Moraxella oculi TaxID=2940516 RepID=A0ABW8U859_9GAMM